MQTGGIWRDQSPKEGMKTGTSAALSLLLRPCEDEEPPILAPLWLAFLEATISDRAAVEAIGVRFEEFVGESPVFCENGDLPVGEIGETGWAVEL